MDNGAPHRRIAGFTSLELATILAVLAGLALLLLAAWGASASKRHRISCVGRLKNIGMAFRIFATDHQDRFPMAVPVDKGGSMEFVNSDAVFRHFVGLSNMLSAPIILVCPADKSRRPALNFSSLENFNVSYFVGLDAMETQPQALLVGDRNLTTNGSPVKPGLMHVTTNTIVGWTSELHKRQGNVAMGDGSVQQFDESRLTQAMWTTGYATNRFLVP